VCGAAGGRDHAPIPPEPQKYQIRMADTDCAAIPAGTTYVWRIIARGGDGEGVSGPSNEGRFSTCVAEDGTVQEMRITLDSTVTEWIAGKPATVGLHVSAPRPVHALTIDLLTDGRPGFYFYSDQDLRGDATRTFTIIPPRAVTSRLQLEAVDEGGCRLTVAPVIVTVTPSV
jgi:hypothetical protein